MTSAFATPRADELHLPPKGGSEVGARLTDALPDATLVKWLRDMMLIREFEVRCAQQYQQARIGGFCHLYIGQEAAAVGTLAAVEPDDPVITAYRDHGHALARGMSCGACMAEMLGKITGCAKGKGGSMHMFDRPHHLYGGHGIVGAQTPMGAGLAFAARYELEVLGRSLDGGPAKKKVCLCYLGDGALNQGAFHEAMNLAGLFSLPVIYVVENNGYSMGTAIERGTTMAEDLSVKARAYGIDYLEIDGMDVRNIYDRFRPFVDRCRQAQRPGFVNLITYRYQGHSMSDPQKYRTKEEVEQWKERDSIERLAHHLLHERRKADGSPVLTEAEYEALQADVKREVREGIEFAEASPAPDPETELYSDVLLNPLPNMSPIRDYTRGARNPLL
jgi:pyruvate dehydrogenase E1 component alpha subunit